MSEDIVTDVCVLCMADMTGVVYVSISVLSLGHCDGPAEFS